MKKLILLIMMGTMFAIGCSKNKDVAETVKENKTETVKASSSGNEMPALTLTDLEGKTFDSKSLLGNGKKTLFVVAAEWCPHCNTEMPHIQQFYDENKDKVNVVVVFSNVRSSLDAVKKYITENGYTIPVYYDADGTILEGFRIESFPFNLKINGTKIEKRLEAPVDYEKMVNEFSE